MEKIRDEQHLLELFYRADLTAIWERSGEIEKDTKKLKERILEYVERNNYHLDTTFLDKDWPGYDC